MMVSSVGDSTASVANVLKKEQQKVAQQQAKERQQELERSRENENLRNEQRQQNDRLGSNVDVSV